MNILAIESSCDESSVAVVQEGVVRAQRTITQSVHGRFGGVVPDLAGRSHLQLLDRLAEETLDLARLSISDVDLIAATIGPGLVGSLLVGSTYARGLALALQCPFRGIHHLEAHIWSAEIERAEFPLPFLALLVSGGHSLIVEVHGLRKYRVLGSTLDDALGEAFDKVGKLFGLKFPAGAEVEKLAATGDPDRVGFTPPKLDASPDLSFSGLKTAVLRKLRNMPSSEVEVCAPHILASFQQAALASVEAKVRRGLELTGARAVICAGGVAANKHLQALIRKVASDFGLPCVFPLLRYCGDNSAMIGYLAWKLERRGIRDGETTARPRWPVDSPGFLQGGL